MANPLVIPMAAHVGWTAALYGLLTLVRLPAAWGLGTRTDGSNPWAALEKRVSANLSNQFEWPLFFHVACLLLLLISQQGATPAAVVVVDPVQRGLAWTFIAGRVAHSVVHLCTTGVRLRGVVFMVNFVAVLGMWGRVVVGV